MKYLDWVEIKKQIVNTLNDKTIVADGFYITESSDGVAINFPPSSNVTISLTFNESTNILSIEQCKVKRTITEVEKFNSAFKEVFGTVPEYIQVAYYRSINKIISHF